MAEFAPKCLPVVALPLEGECLGSWFGRIATNYAVSVSTLLRSIGMPIPSRYLKNWLLLKPVNKSDSLLIAKACRRSQESIVSMVPAAWHLSHQCEFGICVRCLLEDQSRGIPLYWRRNWLKPVSVICDRHASWLTPIDSDLFRRFNNWTGIEQILLDKAARVLRGPEQNKILDCLDKSSPFLQWLFKKETADKIAEFRYGFNDARSACQVATDLLDVLLHISSSEQRHSSLHEYAWYLKIPFENQRLSINVVTNRQMSLRHIQTIEARAFAIAVTDAIMFARARLNAPQAAGHLTENQSFWINSLWVFLPKCGVELLSHRAQNWPLNYVQTCWPELWVTRESDTLQSNQKALRSHFIHENTRLIRSRLANIRSN